MNNLDKMLYLKMGNKLIFKEPLKGMKYAVENYQNQNSNMNNRYNIYKPGYNQQSNAPNPNNSSNKYPMNNNNRKINLQNMDVIPKFIYYENKIVIIIAIFLFVYSQNICNYENIFIANGPMVVVLIFLACMYFYGANIQDFFYWAQAYCVLGLTMFNI